MTLTPQAFIHMTAPVLYDTVVIRKYASFVLDLGRFGESSFLYEILRSVDRKFASAPAPPRPAKALLTPPLPKEVTPTRSIKLPDTSMESVKAPSFWMSFMSSRIDKTQCVSFVRRVLIEDPDWFRIAKCKPNPPRPSEEPASPQDLAVINRLFDV